MFIVYYCIEATITRMNIKFIVMQVGISKQIVTIEQYIYIKLTISIFYIKRKKKHKKNSNFVYLLKKKQLKHSTTTKWVERYSKN